MKKVVNEQVRPAVQARAAKAQAVKAEQQFALAQASQEAVVAR